MDLRDALRELPVVDFVDLLDGLWSDADENAALLLEWQAHAATVEWQRLTVDPDDPEVKAAREAAKEAGLKPPPVPLIVPMARRPWRQQVRRAEEFGADLKVYAPAADAAEDAAESVPVESFLDTWMDTYFG